MIRSLEVTALFIRPSTSDDGQRRRRAARCLGKVRTVCVLAPLASQLQGSLEALAFDEACSADGSGGRIAKYVAMPKSIVMAQTPQYAQVLQV